MYANMAVLSSIKPLKMFAVDAISHQSVGEDAKHFLWMAEDRGNLLIENVKWM